MRRGRIFIYMAVIVIIGLVVVYILLKQYSKPTIQAPPTPSLVDVFIAGQNIPQGSTINEDSLDTVQLPQDKIKEIMFTADQKDQLIGKLAKYPLQQGVMITRQMVVETTTEIAASGPPWISMISPSMTAIAVPISRLASVAYGIADGAHVNVIACLLFVDVDPSFQSNLPNYTAIVTGYGTLLNKLPILSAGINSGGAAGAQGRVEYDPTLQQPFYVVPSEAQRPRPVCQMIFQDVVVIRLGTFPLQTASQEVSITQPQPTPEGPTEPAVTPIPPDIVTLMVSPQDAVTLTYLVYSGAKFTLTLRGAGDQSRIETEAATLQYVLSQYAIPVPAKLPYALQPRIDELLSPILPNDNVIVP